MKTCVIFFFNDTASTEIYTLSLHDALPISAIARQRWTTVGLGAEARLDFATSPVRGVLRGGLLPVVAVHGLPGPDVALTAAAGMEYRSGSITGGLVYELERYDFPGGGAGRRP